MGSPSGSLVSKDARIIGSPTPYAVDCNHISEHLALERVGNLEGAGSDRIDNGP